jgi:Tyrosine phosphatase family
VIDRHLPLEGTYNVRDIGGYVTRDGRRTRWRTLLRADSLHRLTRPAQAELLAYGVRTIVDLRHAGEQAAAPNVFAESTDVRYVHAPLLEDPKTRRSGAPSAALADVYQLALRTRGQQIVAVSTAWRRMTGCRRSSTAPPVKTALASLWRSCSVWWVSRTTSSPTTMR